jgi:hypothetical protein
VVSDPSAFGVIDRAPPTSCWSSCVLARERLGSSRCTGAVDDRHRRDADLRAFGERGGVPVRNHKSGLGFIPAAYSSETRKTLAAVAARERGRQHPGGSRHVLDQALEQISERHIVSIAILPLAPPTSRSRTTVRREPALLVGL